MKLFAYAVRDYDELPYLEALSKELGFEFGYTSEYPSMSNAELAGGYDSLSIITNPLDAELLARFHELGVRGVSTRTIGYDHIDLEAAERLGIRVANAPYPPTGVADYTIMMILMALRKAKLISAAASYQDFGLTGKIGRPLSSCTVGVVGTGQIGEAVCRRLAGFGCRILASDPYEKDALRDIVEYTDLDTLLAASDVVTLHAPGLPQNTRMIDAAAFARMKEGVVLVNAARGVLVDTAALMDAIESGHVGAAALDTIENEANLYYHDLSRKALPNRDRAVLMSYPNVIVTPHMAFYTDEAVESMVANSCRALLAFSRGDDSPFEVHAS
ncbi:D-isomer specific 2-hydroxyacid dehydrogenase family protein [Paratractidigestivibacter sp.]|uniref:D-isomer specific 2-hydroxyacid dehydrogenase family protein n=1 Tax=Paratractidigestivibacter sp. TaxID=2847316 RepID=UPI002AC99AE8|nr:D-isomer specific 2-hydroxyacid dehydrogenase family protein [Paratractidigestivibacter sp.]